MATLGPELEAAAHTFIGRAEVLLPAQQTDGDGLPPAPAALKDIGDSLRALVKGLPPVAEGHRATQMAAALAGWPGFQSALLRTTVVASRIRLGGPATEAEEGARRETGVALLKACLLVCKYLVSLGAAVPGPSTSPKRTCTSLAVLDFARRLLRAETLQALAARLAEVRQAVSGGDAGQLKPTVFASYYHCTLVVAGLLRACLTCVAVTSAAAGEAAAVVPSTSAAAAAESEPSHPTPSATIEATAAAAEAQAAAQGCYRSELAAALRSSCIAEHIAATTLALLRAYDGCRDLTLSPGLAGMPDQLLVTFSTYTFELLQLSTDQAVTATSARAATTAPSLLGSAPSAQHSPPLAALGRAAALGPCGSYLTLAYGMSVLSYMDGDGTRGLPEDVERALGEPLRLMARGRLQEIVRDARQGVVPGPPQRRQAVDIMIAVHNLLNALRAAAVAACAAILAAPPGVSTAPAAAATACAAPPSAAATPVSPPRRLQLGWHTALGLAMRAARMGVRAAEEAAAGRTRKQEAAALAAALTGRGTFRVLLGEELAGAVAVESLGAAARLRILLLKCRLGESGSPTIAEGPARGGEDDQGAEWWRLMARVAPYVCLMQMMDLYPAVSFGQCLRLQLPTMPTSADPLSPVAPPAVASALAGGVLPCLERLIRRATAAAPGDAQPGSPIQEVALEAGLTPERAALAFFQGATSLLVSMSETWGWLAPLLAYGDPREAGALVTSLGKALAGGHSTSRLSNTLESIISNLLLVGATWLGRVAARLKRGGALTPPERQLAGLLGAAAAAWLPEASRRIWSGPLRTQAGTVNCLMPLRFVSAGLLWLPLLSCAATPTAGDAAAAAASSGPEAPATNLAATSSGGGAGGGGWGSFAEALFPRQILIPLAVDIQQRANSDDGSRQALAPWTAEAACTFAALRPQEAAAVAARSAGAGPGLRVEQIRALAAELKALEQAEAADAAEALAAQLVRWERGGGARGGGRSGGRAGAAAAAAPLAARYGLWVPRLQSAAALLPPSPAAARQLLGGCSNPACANLEGDSDAALPLRACAGCGGAASYCSRECQTAHWQSGHREACGGGGAGGGGRGGAG